MPRCIYCGMENDLSKSDIIPDALTSAKIINPNVCRVAHNNRFSDMFENEVIEKLAIITNQLDIKSSKGNNYARYSANIIVDGTEYKTKMTSETELFQKRIMRSTDGKSIIGPIDEIKKIKGASSTNVTEIDLNEQEVEKKISFDMSVFFGKAMHRLISKIAYEWYCLSNNVTDKMAVFEPLIDFIVVGEGISPVSIVRDEGAYSFINKMTDLGSHTLMSYVAKDGSVNILISLFGIAIYNVRVCNNTQQTCPNNVLFLTINIDAQRSSFKYRSLDELETELKNGFHQMAEINGLKIMCPSKLDDTTVAYKTMYLYSNIHESNLSCGNQMDDKILSVLKKQINLVLNVSALTVRSIKRFVKEHKEAITKGIKLNPDGKNQRAIFMFYLLYVSGIESNNIYTFKDLELFVKEKFGKKIAVSNEVCHKMQKEMLEDQQYAKVILRGAKIIEEMGYD